MDRDRRSPVVAGLWGLEIVLVVLHVLSPTGTYGDVTYLLGVWLAPALAWYGTSLAPRGRRLMPALIAGGLTASALGDLIWLVITWTGTQPDTSVADVPYLLAYLGLGGAAVMATTARRGLRSYLDTEAVIDVLTAIVISLLIFWSVAVQQILADQSITTTTRIVWAAYPILDAVLLAIVVRALTVRSARRSMGVPFVVGIICWLLADIGYALVDVTGTASMLLDLGWMLGGMLVATSTLTNQAQPYVEDESEPVSYPMRRLGLATGPLLVPPTMLLINVLADQDPDVVPVLIGSFALVGLTFLRMAGMLRAESRSRRDLAAARDDALEASRAKSAFLATMSHEIRTPMNGVIGLTDLLLTTPLDQRQRQYADGVRSAGSALLTIINDILDFSKVEAGRLDLEQIDFDLVQLVEEVAELVAEPARDKDLELLAYCSPELPTALRGDPSRLRQVLINLAGNAVKFTHEGEVVIRAELQERTPSGLLVRFEVSDTGIGIPEEHRVDLFEPFSQADTSTTRRYGGTGLGLAICRQLVAAMGGELGVTSELGVGSTFWATVPLTAAVEPEPAPLPSEEVLTGLRVLVVDDNETNRVILHDQLTAWGMSVKTVPDAEAALDLMHAAARESRPFDLGVLDLCMPGLDGLELGSRISADADLAGTPLVLLTSGRDVSQAEAHAAGIAASLTKPVLLTRLRTQLRMLVASPPRPVDAAPPPQRAAARGRVLVVEDGEINQLVATGILESLGFQVDVADDGYAALEAIERTAYDAVLMDVRMPNLDGFGATAEVRRREGPDAHVPIIAMTASAIEGDREECLAAGMDDYISKPIDRAVVDTVLGRWIGVR